MVDAKQVKVDNWGIFFLHRLQQFYNKSAFCDLTLRFEDNVEIKVHRLVMSACTEYFQTLEKLCLMEKDCLIMPSNLTSDVVIPIINFMYSGILEFHESSFERLYSTAKLMNMSVLTKLLDAQKTPMKPVPRRVQSVMPITWNLQGRKITTKSYVEPELPETLPGRKLPIWKRKSIPTTLPYLGSNNFESFSPKVVKQSYDEPPKPTRFEWPEEDSSFENSFDDISYESKPLIMPALSVEKSPKPSTSTFEDIKRTILPVKRSASPLGNQCKKVNIQDVKEYLKEHKIRSDYIDYDDSQITDNDLQTFHNDDSNEEQTKDEIDVFTQNTEDTPNKSILKNDSGTSSTHKHVRFSLDGKENIEKKVQPVSTKIPIKTNVTTPQNEQDAQDMSKHKKIITEVLKKYPHLVKNNKNIRLKILAKGAPPPNIVTPLKASTPIKQPSKISYKVVNPEHNQKTQVKPDNKEQTSWECTQCEGQMFTSYLAYRQHLTEVHNEKQDSQMCNVCGHTSRKQNMLVYHKFVKHNIPPPAMFKFPKCKECNYVALSPIILQKHMASHEVATTVQETITNLTCKECNSKFSNKTLLISHLQQTGHVQDRVSPPWGCSYCDKMFFSENNLNMHIKRSHNEELKGNINTKEESVKTKEKIKIISDVKVSPSISNQTYQLKNEDEVIKSETQPEQSSEAEALSNVASGIAASLGLVDTIVVLDDNQFILQSQHGNIQQNISNEFILPHMHMNDIPTSTMSQHPTVTLSSDTNTVLTQSFHKSGITSTDELVMVLTDHDYSDGTNNAVISDNNIVVLYSHPVQTQAGTMMLTSEAGMIEVDKNYTQNIPVTIAEETPCEESIEMIQQEINNQLDTSMIQSEQNISETTEYQDVEMKEVPQMDENTEIIISDNIVETELDKEGTQINENIEVINEAQILEETQMEIYEDVQMHESEEQLQVINNEQQVQEIQIQELDEKETLTEELQEINENTQAQSVEEKMEEIYGETQLKMEDVTKIQEVNDIQIQEESQAKKINTAYENININDQKRAKMSENIESNVENCEGIILQNEENISLELQEENITQKEDSVAQIQENEPQIEENMLEIQENSPQVEENVLEIEENASEIEESSPQIVENVPEIEENASEMEESSPQTEENVPENEENVSDVEENSPQIEENVPEVEENASETEESSPQTEENVPEIEENASEMEENSPQNEENVSEVEENSPQNEENVSEIEEHVLEVEENSPQIEENISDIEETVSKMEENLPQVEENVPVIEENLPQTEDKVQEIEENIQSMEVEDNLSQDDTVEENQNVKEGKYKIKETNEKNKEEIEKMVQDQQKIIETITENIGEVPKSSDIIKNYDTAMEVDSESSNTNMDETGIKMKKDLHSQDISMPKSEGMNEEVQFTEEENVNSISCIVETESPKNIDNSKPEDVQMNSEENLIEQNTEEDMNDTIIDESSSVDSQESKLEDNQITNKVEDIHFIQTDTNNVVDKQNEETTEEIKITDDVNLSENKITQQEKSSQNNTSKNDNGSQLVLRNERISELLDDWDDGDTDSQQSFSKSTPETVNSSINKLIDDWDDEEDS